jgi:DNA-binding NarL/FixJ family response regulator
MTSTVVLSHRSPRVAELERALAAAGAAPLRHLDWRRPVGEPIAAIQPELIFIDEPACSPLPLAVIREARSSAPRATVIVRAAWPDANWLVDAQLSGASAVLPSQIADDRLAATVGELLHTPDLEPKSTPLRWAA